MTDATALSLYAHRRDPEAFRHLVTSYQGLAYSACRRHLDNPSDIDDAVQETFIKLARHARQVRGNVASWVYTCAVHTAIDLVRRGASRRKHETAAAEQRADIQDAGDWAEVREQLDETIAELDAGDRDLIVDYYFTGRTQQQIADGSGLSQPTIKRRLDKAVANLRRDLARRGVTAGAAGIAAILTSQTASAQVPAELTISLTKIGLSGAGTCPGIFSGAITMAASTSKLKLIAAAVAAVALLGVGGVVAINTLHNTNATATGTPAAVSSGELDQRTADALDAVIYTSFEVRDAPAVTLLYVEHTMTPENMWTFNEDVVQPLVQAAMEAKLQIKPPLQFVFDEGPSDPDAIAVIVGIETANRAPVPEGYDFMDLPAGRYATLGVQGSLLATHDAWNQLMQRATGAGLTIKGPGRSFYYEYNGIDSDANYSEVWIGVE